MNMLKQGQIMFFKTPTRPAPGFCDLSEQPAPKKLRYFNYVLLIYSIIPEMYLTFYISNIFLNVITYFVCIIFFQTPPRRKTAQTDTYI